MMFPFMAYFVFVVVLASSIVDVSRWYHSVRLGADLSEALTCFRP